MANPKLILVILRGGMDGLAAISPPEKNALAEMRQSLEPAPKGLPLCDGFSSHPSLVALHEMFRNQDLSFLHSAGLLNLKRSHFRSQDILESGHYKDHPLTGWLGRALTALGKPDLSAIAYGTTLPLLLRGYKQAYNWSAPDISAEDSALLNTLGRSLYTSHPVLKNAIDQIELLGLKTVEETPNVKKRRRKKRKTNNNPFSVIGEIVARDIGPDIGVIGVNGWDTHTNQSRTLTTLLKDLDTGLLALKSELAPVWKNSVIIVTTEFGRTVQANGSSGTDHGTGSVLILAGGAVNGGKRFGTWPGLESSALHEGRDLAVANPVFDVFAHILSQHLGVSDSALQTDIFPGLSQAYKTLPLLKPSSHYV